MTKKRSSSKFSITAAIMIKKAIDSNPISRKHIQDLAPGVYVGRNQLQVAFKRISGGITIQHYRLIKRMEAAKEMLANEGMTVMQVATRCGYKKQSNFTVDFKKIFEQTPGEWLSNHFGDRK